MLEGPEFTGTIGINNGHDNFFDVTQRFYHKLDDDMSIESFSSLHMSNGGGSLARSLTNSSVGSNGSATLMLSDPSLNHGPINYNAGHSVTRRTTSNGLTDDGLAQALLDSCLPTKGLKNSEEWTIELRKLSMGPTFAHAFEKLYRGSYNDEDVAIKLLEKPEDNVERANRMEQ